MVCNTKLSNKNLGKRSSTPRLPAAEAAHRGSLDLIVPALGFPSYHIIVIPATTSLPRIAGSQKQCQSKNQTLRATGLTQQIRYLLSGLTGDLSSILGTHMVEGENQLPQVVTSPPSPPNLHTCLMAYASMCCCPEEINSHLKSLETFFLRERSKLTPDSPGFSAIQLTGKVAPFCKTDTVVSTFSSREESGENMIFK